MTFDANQERLFITQLDLLKLLVKFLEIIKNLEEFTQMYLLRKSLKKKQEDNFLIRPEELIIHLFNRKVYGCHEINDIDLVNDRFFIQLNDFFLIRNLFQ